MRNTTSTTAERDRQIAALAALGVSRTTIGRRFGISGQRVSQILGRLEHSPVAEAEAREVARIAAETVYGLVVGYTERAAANGFDPGLAWLLYGRMALVLQAHGRSLGEIEAHLRALSEAGPQPVASAN